MKGQEDTRSLRSKTQDTRRDLSGCCGLVVWFFCLVKNETGGKMRLAKHVPPVSGLRSCVLERSGLLSWFAFPSRGKGAMEKVAGIGEVVAWAGVVGEVLVTEERFIVGSVMRCFWFGLHGSFPRPVATDRGDSRGSGTPSLNHSRCCGRYSRSHETRLPDGGGFGTRRDIRGCQGLHSTI
jgi:hypothetical protein